MTKSALNGYRQILTALRSRLNGNISHLKDEALRSAGHQTAGGQTSAPSHMAELGTENFEQEFTLTLLQNEGQVLEEISDALERIRRGSFGKCEECSSPIPKARLQAVPYARHCVNCARKVQQSQ